MRWPTGHVRTQLLATLAALAGLTALFWAFPLDLAAARAVASADPSRVPACCAFPLADREPWRFVYRYGVFAGVLLAAGALVLLTATYWYPRRLRPWRRPALFLVLVVALGPGLVVNAALKDHYGRPRPRDVVELGGRDAFVPVGVPRLGGQGGAEGKSFPCGHCSMGFYLAVPWLALRRRRPALGRAFLAAGLAAGGLLGAARMMAGGHFLSDVLWSAGLVWVVALVVHHAMDLDREDAPAPAPGDPAAATQDTAAERRQARVATFVGGGALALLTGAALVATPYVSSKAFARSAGEIAASRSAAFEVALDRADVTIEAGQDFRAAYDVRAFGFPTSKVVFAFREAPEAAVLGIDRMGWFTERRTDLRLVVPSSTPKPFRLRLGHGRVTLDARGFAPDARLDVEVEDGEVTVLGAPGPGVRARVVRPPAP
ncbi:MAG: phosphatase PAP2 family protein [Anaeromyxobacter sp.]